MTIDVEVKTATLVKEMVTVSFDLNTVSGGLSILQKKSVPNSLCAVSVLSTISKMKKVLPTSTGS